MRKIGLVINPIAGMGGRVGLKGTDGIEVLKKARELGSIPEAPLKAKKALEKLLPLKDSISVLVSEGQMGEEEVKEVGLNYEVVYKPEPGETSNADTTELCKIFEKENVELILFVGGDGTARDIFNAIETRIPAIGVPAGVKIHSPVYGNTPESAGQLAYEYLDGAQLTLKDEEVVDLDEDAFREDRVEVRVYGYLKVPYNEIYLQNMKSQSPQSDEHAQESIALDVIDDMQDDLFYIIGSGTTTMYIMKELGLDYTILGVDIIKNKKLVAKDVNEQQILDIIGDEPFKLIVTPMGGQGYIFGRGNQQLSSRVLNKVDKKDVTIVSTAGKLATLQDRDMLIYTLDDKCDEKLSGYYRVVIGYGRYMVHRASNGSASN
ncbi:ATP-NAD kinase family protein [Microaceticoccus formicicus]|uniref:ATP-NAD kinase family protein n=1 Tax=Microaceticoccus formicicus TaxID=3118105 RepID=UPI003CD01B4D|nr:ATP-NAD kinase family protein [Peptoniphilaceae bacterium AMB_02]